jgi:hypothetical protein
MTSATDTRHAATDCTGLTGICGLRPRRVDHASGHRGGGDADGQRLHVTSCPLQFAGCLLIGAVDRFLRFPHRAVIRMEPVVQ